MNLNQKIKPIILCGGEGTRLWPESRATFPKQFIKVGNKSLLKHAIQRVTGSDFDTITFSTNENFLDLIKKETKNIKCKIIVEPEKKNTAAAILASISDDDITSKQPIIILSSDHIIKNDQLFKKHLESLKKNLGYNKIFIFGVKAEYPETGYGYIKSEKLFGYRKVTKFIEKPNLKIANLLFKDKNVHWNSGTFFSTKNCLIEEFAKYQSNLSKKILNSVVYSNKKNNCMYLEKKYFKKISPISFDYAIVEKSKKVFMSVLPNKWTDVGSWYQRWNIEKKSKNNNLVKGKIFLKNTSNSYFFSENKPIVADNLSNILAVNYDDVLYLSNLKKNSLKDIYPVIKKKFAKVTNEHSTVHRPWGYFRSLYASLGFQVKEIVVYSGGCLSLQKHKFRSENWVVVSGIAKVTLNKKSFYLKPSQSVFVKKGSIHRIENTSKKLLRIIEVQTGSYLGEDDIIRIKDVYGRN